MCVVSIIGLLIVPIHNLYEFLRSDPPLDWLGGRQMGGAKMNFPTSTSIKSIKYVFFFDNVDLESV